MEKASTQKRMNTRKKIETGFVIFFLLPAILHFCIFYIYINGESLLLAFRDDNGFTSEYFGRFFNQLTKSGTDIRIALQNTLLFFIQGTFFMFPISLIFSYLLYKKVYGYKYFKIIFFMPSIISAVVLVTLYKNVLDGPISDLWMMLNNTNVNPLFLNSTEKAIWSILVYQIWLGLAGNMIIYSGTMARIPEEVIESAKLDGIGFWSELFKMVIPLIWPTLSTLLLLSFVNIFGASGPILLFTQGDFGTTTIAYWVFAQSTSLNPDYSYASAVGLVFTMVQLPIVFLVRYASGKIDGKVEY